MCCVCVCLKPFSTLSSLFQSHLTSHSLSLSLLSLYPFIQPSFCTENLEPRNPACKANRNFEENRRYPSRFRVSGAQIQHYPLQKSRSLEGVKSESRGDSLLIILVHWLMSFGLLHQRSTDYGISLISIPILLSPFEWAFPICCLTRLLYLL